MCQKQHFEPSEGAVARGALEHRLGACRHLLALWGGPAGFPPLREPVPGAGRGFSTMHTASVRVQVPARKVWELPTAWGGGSEEALEQED